jgi:hypothetical protein
MNCQEFNDNIFEYVDEALSAPALAAARDHVRVCADCRCALLREQARAHSIQQSLNNAVAGLAFSPKLKQNLLRLPGRKPTLAEAWKQIWQRLFPNSLRPIGFGAALLCFGLLVLEIQVHRRSGRSVQQGGDTRGSMYVVDVPIQTQTHVFVRQNNMIVDTLVAGVSVGHAGWGKANER